MTLFPIERVERRILQIRGHRVIVDADLAESYGVSTKRLNEQVRRNAGRFPADFMFRVTARESAALRSQFATSKNERGGRRTRPWAFTEHGAIMAASVLSSPRAVTASVVVVRAFVRLRQLLSTHRKLAQKLGNSKIVSAGRTEPSRGSWRRSAISWSHRRIRPRNGSDSDA